MDEMKEQPDKIELIGNMIDKADMMRQKFKSNLDILKHLSRSSICPYLKFHYHALELFLFFRISTYKIRIKQTEHRLTMQICRTHQTDIKNLLLKLKLHTKENDDDALCEN